MSIMITPAMKPGTSIRNPFVLSLWFDKLTTFGINPLILSLSRMTEFRLSPE